MHYSMSRDGTAKARAHWRTGVSCLMTCRAGRGHLCTSEHRPYYMPSLRVPVDSRYPSVVRRWR